MIELKHVTKIYDAGNHFTALKQVNLCIQSGEIVAITGPSGSGKSTLMHIMGLLDSPTHGKYFLDGVDTAQFSANALAILRNQRIGFVFQQFFLLPKLTALQNVLLPLTYRQDAALTDDDIKECAAMMLKKVGMTRWASHYPNELSGGQQQRVAIARALVNDPKIILADEPTGALDSETSKQIMSLMTEEMQELKKTVVIITHADDIARQCKRQIHIQDGRVE